VEVKTIINNQIFGCFNKKKC